MLPHSGRDLRTRSHFNELSLRQSPVCPLAGEGVQQGGDSQRLLANCCCQPLPGDTSGVFRGQGVKPITSLSIEVPEVPRILSYFFQLKCYTRLHGSPFGSVSNE